MQEPKVNVVARNLTQYEIKYIEVLEKLIEDTQPNSAEQTDYINKIAEVRRRAACGQSPMYKVFRGATPPESANDGDIFISCGISPQIGY